MRFILSLAMIGVLIVTVEAGGKKDYSKSQPVPEDAKIYLELEKEEYFLGEVVNIRYVVENMGKEEFAVYTGGDYRFGMRANSFKIKVKGPKGKAPDPYPSGFSTGGLAGWAAVKPGKKFVRELELHRYALIEDEGEYSIEVSHYLGWGKFKPDDIRNVKTEISFKMPDEKEAKKIVDDMLSSDEKSEGLIAIKYPVYLPYLVEKVKGYRSKAFDGIRLIPTPEATEALIDLLNSSGDFYAVKAAGTLNYRLPDPRLKTKYPGRSIWEPSFAFERSYLVECSWKKEFAPRVRRGAARLLGMKSVQAEVYAAFMLECVGNAEDMGVLIDGLDNAVRRTTTLEFEDSCYPRPRGSCKALTGAVKVLLERGGQAPREPEKPGEIVTFLIAISEKEDFRPDGFEKKIEKFLRHEIPYVREQTLINTPFPLSDGIIRIMPGLLADKNVDVRIEACKLAERSKTAELKEPVLKALRAAKEDWLLGATYAAACSLGTRLEVLEILIDRLGDDEVPGEILDYLAGYIKNHYCFSRPPKLSNEEVGEAQKLWRKFLSKYEKEIAEGRQFDIANPDISPAMFPRCGLMNSNTREEWPKSEKNDSHGK
ncbi:MAG: HEAT repeat domain-containing protein [Planctomycetota bacterium]|nr:MAG: HEAT repeat domain-containing protein [Planctomycetota bacterium]